MRPSGLASSRCTRCPTINRRDRPRRRTSAPLGVLFAVVVASPAPTGVITAADRQVGNLDRIDDLEDILVAVDGPAVNYLLIGSDSP